VNIKTLPLLPLSSLPLLAAELLLPVAPATI